MPARKKHGEAAMPLNERIYKLEQLLKNRSFVSFALMQERTEASRVTLRNKVAEEAKAIAGRYGK
jgi:hypothetical protein